ncbi:MAG TPA: polyphosphate kinase 2, partial [Thermoanaerobaculia bacterium]
MPEEELEERDEERDEKKAKKLTNKKYEKELSRLHVELVKLQEWVKARGLKV